MGIRDMVEQIAKNLYHINKGILGQFKDGQSPLGAKSGAMY
jgi:hypothetical protein